MRRKMFSRSRSNCALLALMIAFILIVPIQTVFSSVSTEEKPLVSNVSGEILFSDDFDDGTLNKWHVGPWNPTGVMEVTNAVSHSPDYSAHSQSDPGTNTAPYIRAYYNYTNHVLVEAWIYLPEKTQAYDRFRLLQVNNVSGKYLLGILLDDDDYSIDIVEDTTTDTDLSDADQAIFDLYTLQQETWYKIGLLVEEFDYEVFVNDVNVYKGTRTKSTALDSVLFGDVGGTSGVCGDAYLDDVVVKKLPTENVDLSISDSDISFSDDNLTEGNSITIQATIHGDYDIWENTTESEILFSDNFDDGTLNKWYIGPWNPVGIMEVTDAVSHSPNYCAHSQSDPDTNTAPYIAADFNDTNHVLIEGWIYLPQKQQEYDRFSLLQARSLINGLEDMPDPSYGVVGDRTTYYIGIFLGDDNYSLDVDEIEVSPTKRDNWVMNIFTLEPETWYKLGLLIDGNQYEILVNDESVYKGTRYDDRPVNVTAFGDTGGSAGRWGDAYLDNVLVTGYTPFPYIYQKANNATCTVSFYLDNVSEDSVIYRVDNVFVPANGEITVAAPWVAVEGNHTIIVKVENVNPDDRDYSNNGASATVFVKKSGVADLSMSDFDISFSNEAPIERDDMAISATIHGDYDVWENITESELLFSDDFDDGTLNKWYVGPWNPAGVMEVTNAVSHSPDYSAHSQSDPGTNTAPYIWTQFSESNYVLVEGWIYLPQKIQEYDRFALLQVRAIPDGASFSNPTYGLDIRLWDDDYDIDIRQIENEPEQKENITMDVYTLQPETWYKLGIKVISDQFEIFVNNTPIYKGFRYDDRPINTTVFGDLGGSGGIWGDAYLDDVTVTGYIETQKLAHKAQNATCTVSFYLDEIGDTNLIYRAENVSVPANGEVTVTAPWTAVEGEHTIIVNISGVNPPDYDLSNNMAAKNIYVEHRNIPPVAVAGPDITAYVHEEITFNASNSYDSDGQILFYLWNFGDGSTGTGVIASHTYMEAGIYNVTLIITDDEGASATDSLTVEVLPVPANLEITKVKTSGVDKGYVHTYYEWELVIEVTNTGWSDAIEIEVKDGMPHNLVLVDYATTAGNVTIVDACNGTGTRASSEISIDAAPSPPTTFPMKETQITWNLEKLMPGESQRLYLMVSTKDCGFCNPGVHYLNKGARVIGVDTLTGGEIFAGPTDPITVEINKLKIKPPDNGNIELLSRNGQPNPSEPPVFWSLALLVAIAVLLVSKRRFVR